MGLLSDDDLTRDLSLQKAVPSCARLNSVEPDVPCPPLAPGGESVRKATAAPLGTFLIQCRRTSRWSLRDFPGRISAFDKGSSLQNACSLEGAGIHSSSYAFL